MQDQEDSDDEKKPVADCPKKTAEHILPKFLVNQCAGEHSFNARVKVDISFHMRRRTKHELVH